MDHGMPGRQWWIVWQWCRNGFAVKHPRAIQDLQGVLFLREVEAVGSVVDVDAQEMMQRPHVGHGEFTMKRADDRPEKRRRAASEDYVINVKEEICRVLATVDEEQQGVSWTHENREK